ncbi:MAG: hypothetical protein CR985_03410 [Flavobacteriales bacterium]|nr:MAG: hypothetical protein CR985_03410 [Flavobacteriales bacterium]
MIFLHAFKYKSKVFYTFCENKIDRTQVNIVLGVALIGIVLVPYNSSLSWLHYAFAILFFAGSGIVIFFFQHPNHQIIGKILAVIFM